jgi:nitrogenase molybdenum-cofactor synthesis protein NifE
VAFCDFNHDRVIEFEGFDGFLNFAREVDASINSPVWSAVKQRILKPGIVETEKGTESGNKVGFERKRMKRVKRKAVSRKIPAKQPEDMGMKPDYLFPAPNKLTEDQIEGQI